MRESSSTRHSSILRWLSVSFPPGWQKRKAWNGGFTLAEIGRGTMLDPWKSSYKYINFDAPNAEETWRTTGKKSQGQGQGKGLDKTTALNSDCDLYSKGKDRMSVPALEDEASKDDIIRAADGSYLGLASGY